MTLLELLANLRANLYDVPDRGPPPPEVTYTWEVDDALCLWKNAELMVYLNEACNELARRQPIRDDARSAMTRLSLRPGTARYNYSPRILAIDDVRLETDGIPLTKLSMADEWNRRSDGADPRAPWGVDRNHDPGKPYYYSLDTNERVMTLYDTPSEIDYLLLTVRRLPKDPLNWDQRATQIPEFPEHIHDALLLWAAVMAYRKRDSDTGAQINAELSGFYQGQFTQSVGPRISFVTEATRKEVAGKRLRTRAQYY